ncbi:cation:proton antiporter [Acetivibrio ethanolgignens]|uniref:Potassium transporter n=1 Tax=Acetivibrio ethanolgignens TaxID=290052 RepID=A0A0V8QGB8_9FIRM|nr:cation:proton antiporter [Acetivibrio ethanolgignens]KSV59659.1 potassium transporter [Acetivibrio ethanolgignens]
MTVSILFVAAVIFLSVLANKLSNKFGMPTLILFMFIGMLFGSDGIFKIHFDNFELTETVCSMALVFIMFYGGFNLKWKLARPIAVQAVLLSTVGVAVTAGVTTVLCRGFLDMSWIESFLIGAVLSSTDAASVFSILRQKKLNLRDGTASLLEMESGSNDPMSYMLTVIAIGMMGARSSENILLSIYFMGIIVGNSRIKNKEILIPFFDGVTSLAQILIFFLLGLLTFPHKMPEIMLAALAVAVFITLVARPVAVFLLLLPFQCSIRQCLLVSFAGLRGAASSVFAIMVVASGASISYDLFHIVFMVSLFSVAIQGTLLPTIARKLSMVDNQTDVRKTFNDYQEESAITLMRMHIPKGHSWENKLIREIHVPTGSLAIMLKRGKETIITKGDTRIHTGDDVILSVPAYEAAEHERLEEIVIGKKHNWCDKTIAELELPPKELIALILRENDNIIPDGKTRIQEGDIVVKTLLEDKKV